MSFSAGDRLPGTHALFVGRLSVTFAIGTFGRKSVRSSAQLHFDGTQAVAAIARLQRSLHVRDGFGVHVVSTRVHVSRHSTTANITGLGRAGKLCSLDSNYKKCSTN